MSHTSYIETQVYSPMRQIHQDISTKSHYAEPAKAYIGKLICFTARHCFDAVEPQRSCISASTESADTIAISLLRNQSCG